MRKSREESARTRDKIVDIAAAEFRKNGIAATSLADLMGAAGLTHGGFYKHFESKEQLVGECCRRAMEDTLGFLAGQPGTGAVVEAYLSPGHRDDPGSGCPLSALAGEVGRAEGTARDCLSEGVERFIELLAVQMGRGPAAAAVATLVGALTLSRLVNRAELSGEILREAARVCGR